MLTLDGKTLSQNMQLQLKQDLQNLSTKTNKKPTLCCVLIGEDASSLIYIKNKSIACEKIGISFILEKRPATVSQAQVNELLEKLSADPTITGIILQLPIPAHLNPREAISHLSPQKDVDGLTNENLGKLVSGEMETCLPACTAQGVMALLDAYHLELKGKHCVIIGRSLLVGKPLFHLLLNRDATVTICHSKTPDLKKHTAKADIVVTAVGKKGFLDASCIKKGAVVIDVAIIRDGTSICGDAVFSDIAKKAFAASPVPGGVGPLTVALLMQNTLTAFQRQQRL